MPDAPGRSRSLRDSRWGNLAILLVTAIVVMAVAYLSNRPSVSEVDVDTTAAAPLAGDIPPAFTAVDVDGETVSLADYEGEPVWLLFAATWCTSCRSEAPDVQAAYEATGIPEAGFAAGTLWEQLPDDWRCPWCRAAKSEFRLQEAKPWRRQNSSPPSSFTLPRGGAAKRSGIQK